MNNNKWLQVQMHYKHINSDTVASWIDVDAFDAMTAKQRFMHIINNLEWREEGYRLLYIELCGNNIGKLGTNYTAIDTFDLTVQELRDAGMLMSDWEAKGYNDEAQMLEDEADEKLLEEEAAADELLSTVFTEMDARSAAWAERCAAHDAIETLLRNDNAQA